MGNKNGKKAADEGRVHYTVSCELRLNSASLLDEHETSVLLVDTSFVSFYISTQGRSVIVFGANIILDFVMNGLDVL